MTRAALRVAAVVLAAVPPFEISSAVWINAADLDRLAQGPPRSRWIVKAWREWCDTLPARIENLPDV